MLRRFLLFISFIYSCFSLAEANYRIGFYNVPSPEIYEMMQSVSQLVNSQKNAPPTLFTLKRRAEADLPLLRDVLHAYGYFDAYVTLGYQGEFPNVTVTILVSPGPCYRFSSIKIEDPEGVPLVLCNYNTLPLQLGNVARFDTILNTEDHIKNQMGSLGYPFSEVLDHKIIVDQENKEVSVTYVVDTGRIAHFGTITTKGLCKVKRAFICKRVYWKRGELFNPCALTCTDAALQESGLFSIVYVHPGVLAEDGSLEMIIDVTETRSRHIGLGVSYSTDESVGALAQWSHDNLTGMGDSFSVITEISEVVKRGTFVYNRPDFFARHQDLTYSFELRREDTPGFIEKELSFLMRVGRKVNDALYYSYGGRFEKLISTKSDNNENYNLFSLPLHLRIDTSNQLVDRTRGYTFLYWCTPYKAMFNSHIFFCKQELFAAFYQRIWHTPHIILAMSSQVGSIIGQSRISVPAPKRFYAGSSTGLRGYKYLTVSPLCGKTPIGGRSLLIFQVEPRVRIIEKLYCAAFYDFGNVYSPSFPQLDEKFLRSYGVGVRYLTPVGAFRLDIGFPLDKRKGIDSNFQIYASIGQTF
jgi:translocation and assembly module TamA